MNIAKDEHFDLIEEIRKMCAHTRVTSKVPQQSFCFEQIIAIHVSLI